MTEPVSAGSIAAAVSAAVLSLLGVPWLALLWGTVGAVTAMVFTAPESRTGAMVSVVASALVGAALGHGFAELMQATNAMQIVASLVCGAGAKPLLTAAIERAQKVIGGEKW